jgi:hypothetical protein
MATKSDKIFLDISLLMDTEMTSEVLNFCSG